MFGSNVPCNLVFLKQLDNAISESLRFFHSHIQFSVKNLDDKQVGSGRTLTNRSSNSCAVPDPVDVVFSVAGQHAHTIRHHSDVGMRRIDTAVDDRDPDVPRHSLTRTSSHKQPGTARVC